MLLVKRGIYLHDFMSQAIKIIVSIQYLDISFLGELPSAEDSDLTKVKLLSRIRLHFMMD